MNNQLPQHRCEKCGKVDQGITLDMEHDTCICRPGAKESLEFGLILAKLWSQLGERIMRTTQPNLFDSCACQKCATKRAGPRCSICNGPKVLEASRVGLPFCPRCDR